MFRRRVFLEEHAYYPTVVDGYSSCEEGEQKNKNGATVTPTTEE